MIFPCMSCLVLTKVVQEKTTGGPLSERPKLIDACGEKRPACVVQSHRRATVTPDVENPHLTPVDGVKKGKAVSELDSGETEECGLV